jgi:hypothetical protein
MRLSERVDALETDMRTVKSDIAGLKTALAALANHVRTFETRVDESLDRLRAHQQYSTMYYLSLLLFFASGFVWFMT